MKKLITLGLLACAFVSTAFIDKSWAGPIRIGVDVDYTWSVMDQVNIQLNKGANVTNLNSGIAGMLDVDMFLNRFLLVGARAGYLLCLPASSRYDYVIYNQTSTINASLTPLEAGLSLNFKLPTTPLSLVAGVYAGYGFAFASYKNEISEPGQTSTFTLPFHGSGFMGELLGTANFKMFPDVSFNINGGYRLAKIPQMIQSEDVSFNGIPGVSISAGKKGDVLKDSDNNDCAFDFSGFTLGAGISLDF